MLDLCDEREGLLPPQVNSFVRNRSATDCNLVRKAVREDAEQAIKAGDPTVELSIICADMQKFYDSIYSDAKYLALHALGAPKRLQDVYSETSFENEFQVKTTEGSTAITPHEAGERQGNTTACMAANFINILLIQTLKNRQLMYKMRCQDAASIHPDKLGFNYCDDSENLPEGGYETREVARKIGMWSVANRIGINNYLKSFFSMVCSDPTRYIDSIEINAYDRDQETILPIRIDRLKNGHQKSLGILLGTQADTHEVQDPAVPQLARLCTLGREVRKST